jgi:hypothetical protein
MEQKNGASVLDWNNEESKKLKALLENYFPFLLEGESASGADVVDELIELYHSI